MSSSDIAADPMEYSDEENHAVESVNVEIPECEGIPRRLWNTRTVTLYNDGGLLVGEGTCHSVNSDLVLGANGPLGDTHVAVHITRTHSEVDIPEERIYYLMAWPIDRVHCSGASLRDHELRDNFRTQQALLLNPPTRTSARPYSSLLRNPPRVTALKSKELLTQESINLVSSKNCVQPFPREKIRAFRERMYHSSSFKFRSHMKTDVHRSVHLDARGRKMVTIESISVCLRAWMHIAAVPEATFYRYLKYWKDDREARAHGNTGLSKPRKHTEQATATLKCILDKEADHMPLRTRTLKSGDKVVSMCLPATFQWKGKMKEINEVNAAFGLPDISTSNLSKIRSSKFPEYEVKKPGDNFARCSECDRLQEIRKSCFVGSESALKWTRRLDRHLAIARAHRELYYANRYQSHSFPHECLTIMHDKMDHSKTASPVFSHKTKELDGLTKLPVAVTGMIAHGHGDVRYAHYGLEMFPKDSNYTVGSMAKLLRDLELPPKSSSRQLFVGARSTNLLKALLKGAEMCEASLPPPPETLVPATPLPPILNVQMDNAAGDNKNRYGFCYWSLLVANKIFREVYVNFMIVGHTHDDIDALFGRWSMLLKKENFLTIPALMKSFMDVETIPTIPHLIEEVPDFKAFIAGKFLAGSHIMIGHTKPQQVKFYLDSTGCPVMKYKLLCTDLDWLPSGAGGGIKLWHEDSEGQSLWPRGVPQAVLPVPMKAEADIVKGISAFINYWENLCNQARTGECRRRLEHIVHYWRGVKVALEEPLPDSTVLKDGFWPTTRVQATRVDQLDSDGEDREEFGEDDVYVGPLSGRPQPSFRVARDLFEGYFVAITPAENELQPVWIARALSDPFVDPLHPNSVRIQYFRPTAIDDDIQKFYTGWDNGRGLRWEIDAKELPLWQHTDAVMTAWKCRTKKNTAHCKIKIPPAQIEIIKQSLAANR